MLTALPLLRTRSSQHRRRWMMVVLVAIGLTIGAAATPVMAQNQQVPCEAAINQAESAYLNGNFQEAINQVSLCLDRQDATEDQVVAANRLLSLSHLRLNELQQARAAIVNIFGVRPGYDADPVEDPPEYVSLVSIVRQEVQPEVPPAEGDAEDDRTPFFRRTSTWLSLIGSVAVGGVVTFLTLGQGGDDGGGGEPPPTGPDPLPPPPGTPTGN